jgi:hypothetical protein
MNIKLVGDKQDSISILLTIPLFFVMGYANPFPELGWKRAAFVVPSSIGISVFGYVAAKRAREEYGDE